YDIYCSQQHQVCKVHVLTAVILPFSKRVKQLADTFALLCGYIYNLDIVVTTPTVPIKERNEILSNPTNELFNFHDFQAIKTNRGPNRTNQDNSACIPCDMCLCV